MVSPLVRFKKKKTEERLQTRLQKEKLNYTAE